jgi:PIN domain nuclease of toxin-antitoxin system
MAFLLDTHTFLWFLSGDEQLSKKALVKILDINNYLDKNIIKNYKEDAA